VRTEILAVAYTHEHLSSLLNYREPDHWLRRLWGTGTWEVPLLDFQLLIFPGHFRQSRANTDIRLHVAAIQTPVKNIQAYSFVTVYCMNRIIFLYVTLKLFFLTSVKSWWRHWKWLASV